MKPISGHIKLGDRSANEGENHYFLDGPVIHRSDDGIVVLKGDARLGESRIEHEGDARRLLDAYKKQTRQYSLTCAGPSRS